MGNRVILVWLEQISHTRTEKKKKKSIPDKEYSKSQGLKPGTNMIMKSKSQTKESRYSFSLLRTKYLW